MSDDLEFLLWRRAVAGATEAERSHAAERLSQRPPAHRQSRSLEADLDKVRAIVEAGRSESRIPKRGGRVPHGRRTALRIGPTGDS